MKKKKICGVLMLMAICFSCLMFQSKTVHAKSTYKIYQFAGSQTYKLSKKSGKLYIKGSLDAVYKTNAKLTKENCINSGSYRIKTYKFKMSSHVKYYTGNVGWKHIYNLTGKKYYSQKKLFKMILKAAKSCRKDGGDFGVIIVTKNNKVIKVMMGAS